MHRAVARLFGFARRAASGSLQNADAARTCGPADFSSRTVWLRPPDGWQAATAAGGSPTPAAVAAAAAISSRGCGTPRGIASSSSSSSSSSSAQHTAQPAYAQGAQQQQQQQPPPGAAEQGRERTCWQCGAPLTAQDLFSCPGCHSVQPASMDAQYFKVFGMAEPVFDLDRSQLEQAFKGLQKRLHPDKFSTAPPLEQEYAHQQAAVINQAYDVLKRPLRRAHYILHQRGFGACEGMTISNPRLLVYVMEAREEVEGASDPRRLQALQRENAEMEAKCIEELAAAFAADDLHRAAELTTQLRYICRIREAIADKL